MRFVSILGGLSLACAVAVSAQAAGRLPAYPSFSAQPASGFGTSAKLALMWHWSEKTIREVGVSKVVSGGKGILCILPKVALNLKGIYPQVTVAYDLSNTTTGFAQIREESDLCPNEKYIEVDTFQLSGSNEKESNNVGFVLTVE